MKYELISSFDKAGACPAAVRCLNDLDKLEGIRMLGLALGCQYDEDEAEPFFVYLAMILRDFRLKPFIACKGESEPIMLLGGCALRKLPEDPAAFLEILDSVEEKSFPGLAKDAPIRNPGRRAGNER